MKAEAFVQPWLTEQTHLLDYFVLEYFFLTPRNIDETLSGKHPPVPAALTESDEIWPILLSTLRTALDANYRSPQRFFVNDF